MKLTLLKWKYQIVKEVKSDYERYYIYKVPYGILKFLRFRKYIDYNCKLEISIEAVEKIINTKKIKPEIVKEYYL